jgi:hypothetical protein
MARLLLPQVLRFLPAHRRTITEADLYIKMFRSPGNYMVVLQWKDDVYSMGQTSNGGTQNDLDIYLTDNNGQTLFGFNRNNIGGDRLKYSPSP